MNIRSITMLAIAALAVGTAPAHATTEATEQMDCGYGQVGYADFTEGNATADWTGRAYWHIKSTGEDKWGDPVTYKVVGGTNQVYTESSADQKLLKIKVTSSGQVATTGVHSCGAAGDCKTSATRYPCVGVPALPVGPTLPIVVVPTDPRVPARPQILDDLIWINCQIVC